jgi:FkbM family methyltransferase
MSQLVDSGALSSGSFLGRLLRYPLKLVPVSTPIPILSGRLRGLKWLPESAIHRCWMGWYESDKQDLIANEVRPGSVFYDIGANVGFYSLLASKLVNSGKVFAFEPSPRNIGFLKKHVELNQLRNVTVLETALGDKDGVMKFETESTGFAGHLSDHGEITVRVTSLDALVTSGQIPPPDYIKMDIEGAEFLALQGASQTLRTHHPEVFLATHGHEVDRQCCELLKSLGYEVRRLSPSSSNGLGEVLARFRVGRDERQVEKATKHG